MRACADCGVPYLVSAEQDEQLNMLLDRWLQCAEAITYDVR